MKKTVSLTTVILSVMMLFSCTMVPFGAVDTGEEKVITEAVTTKLDTTGSVLIEKEPLFSGEDLRKYSIVCSATCNTTEYRIAKALKEAIEIALSTSVSIYKDTHEPLDFEILLGETSRDASVAAKAQLEKSGNDYSISLSSNGEKGSSVVIVAKSDICLNLAVDSLINNLLRHPEDGVDPFVSANSLKIRDPQILYSEGTYYIYGTVSSNGFSCYTSKDLKKFKGPYLVCPSSSIIDGTNPFWAAECREYNGAYYLFATYKSTITNLKCVGVFRSTNPKGPFVLWSDGPVTPAERDCIDGTLYIDEAGNPWLVFVDSWKQGEVAGMGTMYTVRLSEDLKSAVGDPQYLFTADDPEWTNHQVTDGPWLFRLSNGKLAMLWSNQANQKGFRGYSVGLATSDCGKVIGPWKQSGTPFFAHNDAITDIRTVYDGGHAALFTDAKGRLMMSLHISNAADSTLFVVEVEEKDGVLCFKYPY